MDGDQEWVNIRGQIGEILRPKLRKTIERISARSEIAVPFIPYVGPAYPRAQTEILFVGKATDGWGWREDGKWDKSATLEGVNLAALDWYETLSEIPPQFINCLIVPTYGGLPPCRGNKKYPAPFWRSIYRIGSDLLFEQPISQDLGRCPRLSEGTFTSIAWTNVFKVSYLRGNPEKGGDPDGGRVNHRDPLIELQERLLPTLQKEIEILQPKVVLFFTGPNYDRHLEKALPGISFGGSRGLAKVDGLKGLRKGGVALRTYHPGARGHLFNAELVVRYIRECLG